jgi:RNA polymerase II-associated protein 1
MVMKKVLSMNIVGEIVERDVESDEEEGMGLYSQEPSIDGADVRFKVRFPTGFPQSEKVYKPKEIVREPQKQTDEEKLEWMLPLEMTEPGPGCELRFDFQGLVLRGAEDMTDSSLYHHGIEPTKPGYTLQELIHLSKSTVPTQRVVALDTLSKIIAKTIQVEYQESAAIYLELQNAEIFIVGRIALDATHETVLYSALKLISTCLGYPGSFELWDSLFFLKNGLRTIALEQKSLQAFELRSHGKAIDNEEQELGDTIQEVSDQLREDVVMGLLMTNIIPRLRYIMQHYTFDQEAQIQIIHIFTVIAHHSASSAEDILACEDLILEFQSRLIQGAWPLVKKDHLVFISSILRMFAFIAQSSREAADALVKFKLLPDVMRFVTCPPQQNDALYKYKQRVVRKAYCLLSVIFAYGFDGWLIDSYRSALLHSLQHTILQKDKLGQETLAMICKTLYIALTSFPVELDPGGVDDSFYPFVEQLLPLLSEKVTMI